MIYVDDDFLLFGRGGNMKEQSIIRLLLRIELSPQPKYLLWKYWFLVTVFIFPKVL